MRSRTLLSLAALALVGACSTDIPSPTSPASLARVNGVTRSNLSGGVQGIPNSTKYHDSGLQPATGRSGSASLEARALIGRDGNTIVEASTGSLEGGTSSGTIAKVLLKTSETRNFTDLDNNGYWSTTLAGHRRGDAVEVQANVRGIDPKRTDVVTATTSVARLPDLTVRSVIAPSNAPPLARVLITAMVQELNGDVGARADCVLAINGTNVDHADGIWVDALGMVSCQFSHTFNAPGSYDVRVTAANVLPGDWDLSNNSATTSVSVASVSGPISSGLVIVQENLYAYDFWTTSNYGSIYRVERKELNYGSVSMFGYDALSPGPMQRIDAEVALNGAPFMTVSLPSQYTDTYDDGFSLRYTCTYLSNGVGASGNVCTYDAYGRVPSYTLYSLSVQQGSVTYYGHETNCNVHGCNTYTWNGGNIYGGSPNPFGLVEGSIVRFSGTFIDAFGSTHTFGASTNPLYRYDFGPWNDVDSCRDGGVTGSPSCYGYSNWVGHQFYGNALFP